MVHITACACTLHMLVVHIMVYVPTPCTYILSAHSTCPACPVPLGTVYTGMMVCTLRMTVFRVIIHPPFRVLVYPYGHPMSTLCTSSFTPCMRPCIPLPNTYRM